MPRRQVKNAALPSHHLTIVIVISISAPSASPRPAKRRDPPIEGWQRRRWRKKQKKKKKHIYWRLWQQRVKSFGLLSYSVPAPGCGWCYFWRGRGKASATCAAAQGVAVKGWSASGWLTDWLCRCQAIASYIFFCIPFCSPGSTLFQLSCFPCDCSRFVAFRGQLQFVVFGILVCFRVGFGFRLGWVRLGYHDHDIAQEQEQQQHALEKQANNEANLFLFFFFYYYVFFLTSFLLFSRTFLGVVVFFPRHGSNCALLQNTWNFQHEFTLFLVIYNIILTVFCFYCIFRPYHCQPNAWGGTFFTWSSRQKKLMENDNKKTSRGLKVFCSQWDQN